MKIRDGLRALAPYSTRLAGAGRWLALGALLGTLTLTGSLGLLALSGGFLSAAAIAGLSAATAMHFNFFLPGAGVRFFALLRTVSRWGDRVVTHEGTFRLLAGLRHWLYGRLALLSPRQLNRQHGGETLNRLMRDIDALDNLYPRFLLPIFAATLTFAALLAVFAHQAPGLLWLPALLLTCALLLLPLTGWYLGRDLLPASIRERATLRRHLLDCSEGIEDFSLHAQAWSRQRERTLAAASRWLRTQRRNGRRGALLRAASTLLAGLAAWACLASAGTDAQLAGPWLAALTLLLLGCGEILAPLASASLELPGTAGAAQAISTLAGQTPATRFPEHGPAPAGSDLRVIDVGFAWDAHTPVFSALNLEFASGRHVFIKGASGCGKSTLSQLLSRLEDPQSGRIELGGIALEAFDESTLRRQIACAGQFAWAKCASLADNLRLADPDASPARMREVLALVGLGSPDTAGQLQLETWIEAGGASLSGGERKRLGIAQALLRNAPITILDEASEGLDPAAERALIGRLREQLRGRSLLWISHRDQCEDCFDLTVDLDSRTISG